MGEGLTVLTLADTGKKARMFSVVPSLDTPVCGIQTKRFSDSVEELGDKAAVYTVSLDLPFAMKRFCSDKAIANLTNLSDARDHSFGQNYGVLIEGLPLPLLARAIFVVDAVEHDHPRRDRSRDRHRAELRRRPESPENRGGCLTRPLWENPGVVVVSEPTYLLSVKETRFSRLSPHVGVTGVEVAVTEPPVRNVQGSPGTSIRLPSRITVQQL